ncbi:MAG: cupin domain-containing protein [Dehalococcoidia bacterium]
MKVHRISPDALQPGGDEYFIGEARVQPLLGEADGIDIVVVSFSPGARTYLHAHEAPQVLHCLEGRGILATEHERNFVGPGDVVHVPAGEMHWHGATEDGAFTHLSIRPLGGTRWTKTDALADEP